MGGCITLGDSPADVCAGMEGGNISAEAPTSTLPVTCKWPTSVFTSLAAVEAWESKYGVTTSSNNFTAWNTKIMPTLCSTVQSNAEDGPNTCPTTNLPAAGDGEWIGGICSPFVANNPTGAKCREWIEGIDKNDSISKAAANATIINYCSKTLKNINQTRGLNLPLKNGEINECLCLNRGADGPNSPFSIVEKQIADNGGSVISLGAVGCWYEPCSAGINQLLPLETSNTRQIYPTDCPSVCKVIADNEGNIGGDLKIYINCDGSPPNAPGGNSSGRQNPGGGDDGDGDGLSTIWDDYKWYFIIGGAILLVFFIIIVIVGISKSKKKTPADPFQSLLDNNQ